MFPPLFFALKTGVKIGKLPEAVYYYRDYGGFGGRRRRAKNCDFSGNVPGCTRSLTVDSTRLYLIAAEMMLRGEVKLNY